MAFSGRRKSDRLVVAGIYGLVILNTLLGAFLVWHIPDVRRFHLLVDKMDEALQRYRSSQ